VICSFCGVRTKEKEKLEVAAGFAGVSVRTIPDMNAIGKLLYLARL
jgi:hypothetical protein